jgi:uncharacterized membrane protein
MKHFLTILAALACSEPAKACVTCNRAVQDAIFNSAFLPNLGTMLSAFFVLAGIVAALAWIGTRRHAQSVAGGDPQFLRTPVPLLTAATILGIGAGGFADGIVLHQILQWHNMLSAKLPPEISTVNKSVNMFWDGVFHFFTLVVTLVGVVRLWRVSQNRNAAKSGRLLAGGMLLGWGVFNLVEGIIDHQLLKLHNVREQTGSQEAWNMGFLVFSVVLIAIGAAISRSWINAPQERKKARIK